jgi:hypothetical protein
MDGVDVGVNVGISMVRSVSIGKGVGVFSRVGGGEAEGTDVALPDGRLHPDTTRIVIMKTTAPHARKSPPCRR